MCAKCVCSLITQPLHLSLCFPRFLCQLTGRAMNQAREEQERKAGDPFFPEAGSDTEVTGMLGAIQVCFCEREK